jgi:hypothetical protein
MFAAINTVEPSILELGIARLLEGDKPWHDERLPLVEDRVRNWLKQLSARLGDADWLDGALSGSDLMMVSVLLRLKSSGIRDEYPKQPISPAVKRGPPTNGLSPINWRLTPATANRLMRWSWARSRHPSFSFSLWILTLDDLI